MSATIKIPKSIENLYNSSFLNAVAKSTSVYDKLQKDFDFYHKISGFKPSSSLVQRSSLSGTLKLVEKTKEINKRFDLANNITILYAQNSAGMSNSLKYHTQIAKQLTKLETKLNIVEEKKRQKERLRNELVHWINKYESKFLSPDLENLRYPSLYKIEAELIIGEYKALSSIEEMYLEGLIMLKNTEAEIKENDKTISYIKAVKTFLNSVFKRFEVNMREFIGSINNFNFKNLDDTHSTLISLGY